ncbi:hypothetical protein JQX13_22675 [Archangium violaceum]|uniref:hypothetical protein n=1 Tax=Archangium violaceum TaxID=83451 RepID=UPI00193B7A24|nr:hypothetical protein [Archangium violaceum]QRK12584.1 hypothetical protein JQX13_22675 [Archangium violaceum]
MPPKRRTFYENQLIPLYDGYFPRPTPPDFPELQEEPDKRLWLRTEEIFNLLKMGDFSRVEELLEIYRKTEDGVLRATIRTLLGDAGTFSCFQQMREELEAERKTQDKMALYYYRDKASAYCDAFVNWGFLDAVPVIVDHYITLRLARIKDVDYFPIMLSLMMEREWSLLAVEPPEDALEEYLGLVMHRYEALCAQYGSGNVLVFNGELASVKYFAHRLAHDLGPARRAEVDLRRRFEASTGIDCHDMFVDKVFQPLAAARIAESFLNSPDAAKYEDGVRYFFGHRIPD